MVQYLWYISNGSTPGALSKHRLLERTQPGHFVESPCFAFAGLDGLQLRLYPKGELCQAFFNSLIQEVRCLMMFDDVWWILMMFSIFSCCCWCFWCFWNVSEYVKKVSRTSSVAGHRDSQLRPLFELPRAVPAQRNDVHRQDTAGVELLLNAVHHFLHSKIQQDS